MSRRVDARDAPHPGTSLAVPVAAGAAAVAAGALGPLGLTVIAAGAGLSAARARGVRLAVALARPLLSTLVAAVYVPVFLLDFALNAGTDPVLPLARLVAMLCFNEGLGGTRRAPFRPLLLGLLLVIVSAAETTDAWFAAGLLVFATTAVVAASRITAHAGDRRDRGTRPRMPLGHALLIATASLALGTLLFLVVPHSGAGWGRRPLLSQQEAGPVTGLSDEVRLGAIGSIKKRRSIAFRARVPAGGPLDDEQTYWRARVFEEFTGRGWRASKIDGDGAFRLSAGRRLPMPGAAGTVGTVVEVRIERAGLNEIVLPGPPAWIEPGERSTIVLDGDGLPRAYLGAGPRRYRLGLANGASDGVLGPTASMPPAATTAIPTRGADTAAVAAWAEEIARDEVDPARLARAFVRDLASRPYSLDTGAIDDERPLTSFLEGAPAHCEYFASAMVLGLRERGVPARAIGGYLGAERLPFGSELIVRDERAHLWVEAWLPGSGWTLFDPTPAAGRRATPGALALLRGTLDWTVVLWDSWVVGLDLDDQKNLAFAAGESLLAAASRALEIARAPGRTAVVTLASAAALALLLVMLRRRARRLAKVALPPEYARLLRLAARRGLTPSPAETAAEFCRRAGPLLDAGEVFEGVTRLYERERFGGHEPTSSERRRVRGDLARLARAPRATRPPRAAASR